MSEVSVFVPSYNHAPFVERTLRSVFAQTLRPQELLVIDDGSTDDSAEIIGRVLKDCPFRNEFIARENRGLCATLNEGLAKTNGEFFAYIGSDDIWLPRFLQEQTALLKNRPAAVLAFGHAYLIDERDLIVDRTDRWTEYADGNALPHLLRGEVFPSPSVVYRRKFLERFGWNEDARLEDYELYLKLSAEGEFARNDKLLCAWRQHGANASGNLPQMFPEWLAAQDRNIKALSLSRAELDKIQQRIKFNAVADFVRQGYKREAAGLFIKNIGGAESAAQIGRMLLRLAVPGSLFRWNRRRKRQNAAARYGQLEI